MEIFAHHTAQHSTINSSFYIVAAVMVVAFAVVALARREK